MAACGDADSAVYFRQSQLEQGRGRPVVVALLQLRDHQNGIGLSCSLAIGGAQLIFFNRIQHVNRLVLASASFQR